MEVLKSYNFLFCYTLLLTNLHLVLFLGLISVSSLGKEACPKSQNEFDSATYLDSVKISEVPT